MFIQACYPKFNVLFSSCSFKSFSHFQEQVAEFSLVSILQLFHKEFYLPSFTASLLETHKEFSRVHILQTEHRTDEKNIEYNKNEKVLIGLSNYK